MSAKIDDRLEKILKQYHPDPRKAIWNCHGTWVAYHKDLETIARAAKITFDPPVVVEANGESKCVALCVTGHMNGATEWSIGEAAPGNNKNAYPYAMAEKRAKDRVILKLIGLHGDVYSEDEADDFKPQPQGRANGPAPYEAKRKEIETALNNAPDYGALGVIWKAYNKDVLAMPDAVQADLTATKDARKAVLVRAAGS